MGTLKGFPTPPATVRAEQSSALPTRMERVRLSGITVDRNGRFIHEGEEVVHQGLRQALFRWLDRLPPPDSRYVLRLDADRFAYLTVEDTPLVATSARLEGETVCLGLTDGSETALDPTTLTVDQAGTLRCRVRAGRLEARLGPAAAAVLADQIESTPQGPSLRLHGTTLPIAAHSSGSSRGG